MKHLLGFARQTIIIRCSLFMQSLAAQKALKNSTDQINTKTICSQSPNCIHDVRFDKRLHQKHHLVIDYEMFVN